MEIRSNFFALMLFIFATTGLYAQKNVVKLNPLSLFILTGNGQYERVLHPNLSLSLGAFGTGARFDLLHLAKVGYSGWGLTPELRYYPKGLAPNGFYVGAYFRAQFYRAYGSAAVNIRNPSTGETIGGRAEFLATVNGLGGGALIGYQFIIAKRVSIDLFLGLGGNSVKTATEITAQSSDGSIDESLRFRLPLSPVGVRPGLCLGFAF
jgi:hypothetical protein